MNNERFTLARLKDLLWIIFLAGMVIGVGRFIFGLGASTNMTDMLPWGLWKVFNMVAGAALATSGFVVAAIIYIFQLERFRPVAKFSIVVGFLGYGSSLFALLFDIGLPHRGWHPFVMWNPHSFLFEVFWCVSIYWSITAFELLPLITERFPFPKLTHFIHEVMLPVVILGITLSTMHHSSLGSLFLASPTRLHPLWYSLWIPPEFFISAIGAGLSTITLLMLIFSFLYRQALNLKLLSSLVKGSAGFLLLYLIIKILDFSINRKWNFVFGPDLTWESYLFWIEIVLQTIIPIIIFTVPAFRNRVIGLILGTSSAVIGLLMHRINTGIIGYFRSAETVYIPNLSEFLLSLGILSGAGLIFFLIVERFHIFDSPETQSDDHSTPIKLWTSAETKIVFGGARAKKVLITAIIVIPMTWILFQDQATGPFKPILQPISPNILATDIMRTQLRLDGDLNGRFVTFNHKQHQEDFVDEYDLETEETCIKCHHLNLPNDNSTKCRACHKNMLAETPMFDADRHQERFKTEAAFQAVKSLETTHPKENYQQCMECHQDNMKGLAGMAAEKFGHAPGFKDALHGTCQTCHREREGDPTEADDDSNCQFCHHLGSGQTEVAQAEDE